MSHDESGVNDYTNCFYACRYCNQARGVTPVVVNEERRLLNPCRDAWADHFILDGDTLVPKPGDSDAVYTHAVYHLDDPRKVELRRFRRETVKEALQLLERGRSFLVGLLQRAGQAHDPMLVSEAQLIENALRGAWRNLETFRVVPQDAQASCACSDAGLCVIPQLLEAQTIEVDRPG